MSDGSRARYQRVQRSQKEWREFSLEEFVAADASVRAVWAFVESLDLSRFYARIRAVEGSVGRDPIDPRILLALWLYATVEGVSSAREVARLCTRHLHWMWLCGGVSVNYHTLSDFRTQHVDFLDGLLTQSVTALLAAGLVELNRVAQDGMRVRAAAGSSSFRRKRSLQDHLAAAEAQVAALAEERDDEDASRGTRRRQAARQRAAEERSARLRQALVEREKVAAVLDSRQKGSGIEARVSTTDPEARKMKMADGGFRPAYNVQFVTTADSRVVVGVNVTNAGTDGGQMEPMLKQLEQRYHHSPREYLADGGFIKLADITAAEAKGIAVYLPIMEIEEKRAKGIDPYARLKGDTPEVAGWRARMATAQARAIYRERAASAEWTNANCRNHGLQQFRVRGLLKAKAIAFWHALAQNFQRTISLKRQRLAAT